MRALLYATADTLPKEFGAKAAQAMHAIVRRYPEAWTGLFAPELAFVSATSAVLSEYMHVT